MRECCGYIRLGLSIHAWDLVDISTHLIIYSYVIPLCIKIKLCVFTLGTHTCFKCCECSNIVMTTSWPMRFMKYCGYRPCCNYTIVSIIDSIWSIVHVAWCIYIQYEWSHKIVSVYVQVLTNRPIMALITVNVLWLYQLFMSSSLSSYTQNDSRHYPSPLHHMSLSSVLLLCQTCDLVSQKWACTQLPLLQLEAQIVSAHHFITCSNY